MYYVIEFQTGSTGAALVNTYTSRDDAEQKFHQVMAAAAKSAVPKHGCMIITDDLFVLKEELAYRELVDEGANG